MIGVRLAFPHTFEDLFAASPRVDVRMAIRLAGRRCGPKWPEEERAISSSGDTAD
jgi:hypothetical protein